MIYCIKGLKLFINAYFYVISFNILLSWIPSLDKFRFVKVINKISDLYMRPFHGLIVIGFFDLTPIIGLLLYSFIAHLLYII